MRECKGRAVARSEPADLPENDSPTRSGDQKRGSRPCSQGSEARCDPPLSRASAAWGRGRADKSLPPDALVARLVLAPLSRQGARVGVQHRKSDIAAIGRRLGFVDVRFARIEGLDRGEFYERWLEDGRAGDMRFLLHHKKARLDPRSRYPWARTMVSAFFPYAPPPPPPARWREELRGRIASYALGADYHDTLGERLQRWASEIADAHPGAQARGFVDTAPVFEHEWAARSGVGWTGKHTLTLSETRGSWGFLGELLLDLEIEPDPPVADRCGTCRRCIDVCPTGALEAGYLMDPRKCISYLTIEHRGLIPARWRDSIGEWVFGCDLCQEVCPWNDEPTSSRGEELHPPLVDLIGLSEAGFERRFGRSALRRTGRLGLARNAAVVLGNTDNPEAVAPLVLALHTHEAELVRAQAAGALGRLRGVDASGVRAGLDGARRDTSALVRDEVEKALEEL